MKLTITEYCNFFFGESRDAVAKKCRDGELSAEKDDNGRWIIDILIPESIYETHKKAMEKKAQADALWNAYVKAQKEVTALNAIVRQYITNLT